MPPKNSRQVCVGNPANLAAQQSKNQPMTALIKNKTSMYTTPRKVLHPRTLKCTILGVKKMSKKKGLANFQARPFALFQFYNGNTVFSLAVNAKAEGADIGMSAQMLVNGFAQGAGTFSVDQV